MNESNIECRITHIVFYLLIFMILVFSCQDPCLLIFRTMLLECRWLKRDSFFWFGVENNAHACLIQLSWLLVYIAMYRTGVIPLLYNVHIVM